MTETEPRRVLRRGPESAGEAEGAPRSRIAPRVVATLLVGSAAGVVGILAWSPWPGRNTLVYEDLAPIRASVWAGTLLDGVLMGLLGVTLGLAVALLVPGRGSRWAAAAALCTGVGGLLFAAGSAAQAFLVWYATAPTLSTGPGQAVLDHVDAEKGRLYAVAAAGFLLVTLGVLLACVALSRGRVVARWALVLVAVVTLAPLLVSADGVLDVVQSVQSLLLAGIGVLLWRRTP